MPQRWLAQKKPECRWCPYATHQYVPPSGDLDAPIMFIGESPGVNEAERGEVFIGRAGQLLNGLFEDSRLKREDVYITNAIKCHPAVDQKFYDQEAVALCRRLFLDKEIHRVRPTLIVPMGNWALQAIAHRSGITKARGVTTQQKFIHPTDKDKDLTCKILPTFHPAYILRNPSFRDLTVADFKQVRLQAKAPYIIKPKSSKVDYRAFASLKEAKRYIQFCLSDNVKRLSWDIETTSLDYREAQVLCVSLSTRSREAKALHFYYDWPTINEWAYDPELLILLFRLLTSGKTIYLQNGKYDIRVMRYFLRGLINKSLSVHKIGWRDTMCMHALLDENLPHNLKDMCVSGDTLIPIVDANRRSVPIRNLVGKTVLSYAYSRKKGNIVLAEITNIRKTGKELVYEVVLDEGSLKATGNHKVLLRTGVYKRVDQLVPGDSLMPFYRWIDELGYLRVNLNNGLSVHEHVLVGEKFLGKRLKGQVYHHADGNGLNNSAYNLEILSNSEHRRRHCLELEKSGQGFGKRVKEYFDDLRENDPAGHVQFREHCKRVSKLAHAALKKRYEDDPEFREEVRKKVSRKAKKRYQDPEFKKRWYESRWNHTVVAVRALKQMDVYDVETPKYHNFVANGVIVHNSRLNTDIIYTDEELKTVRAGLISKASLVKRTLYACKDADATRRLGIKFERQLKEEGLWHLSEGHDYSDVEVSKSLFDMETFGTPIDLNELNKTDAAIGKKLDRLTKSIHNRAGKVFNLRSYPQLSKVMFEDLRLPPSGRETTTGGPSTDAESLDIIIERTRDPFPRRLKLFRQYDKIRGTFVTGIRNALDDRGRIQADFMVAQAVTGRIVCQNPNLVNIPRDKEFEEGLLVSIRRIFKARPGWVVVAGDWQQIEFKIAAILAGDEKLMHDIFVLGGDVHTLAAQAMYPLFTGTKKKIEKLRQIVQDLPADKQVKALRQVASWEMQLKDMRTDAKRWNFGTLYGGSDEGIAEQMGMDIEEMHKYSQRMRDTYPELARYIRVMPELARKEHGVDSSFGRKRRLPPVYDRILQSRQGRQAINHGPQTDAAYVGRGALVRICREAKRQKLRGFPFNLIYDSVLVECPEAEAPIFVEIMAENMLQSVPELGEYAFSVEMGIGQSWREAEQHAIAVKTPEDAHKVLNSSG